MKAVLKALRESGPRKLVLRGSRRPSDPSRNFPYWLTKWSPSRHRSPSSRSVPIIAISRKHRRGGHGPLEPRRRPEVAVLGGLLGLLDLGASSAAKDFQDFAKAR